MAHLLIVEDDESNAAIARAFCVRFGHTVVWAENGLAAIACLEANRFDLALIDGAMPGMDGLALARRIRAHPAWFALPIIGVTALAFERDREAMHEAGMNAILTKPYRRQALEDAIAALIGAESAEQGTSA